MEVRFASENLQQEAGKCEKEESEKLKPKMPIERSNMDGGQIYAIRKRPERMNYAPASNIAVARVDSQAKMQAVGNTMSSIVKSIDSASSPAISMKMSESMDQSERQFVNYQAQAHFMEGAVAGSGEPASPLPSPRSTISCSNSGIETPANEEEADEDGSPGAWPS